ncbi:hypothetical protein AAMO2058_001710700 [Amorphochlora amoebiformis]
MLRGHNMCGSRTRVPRNKESFRRASSSAKRGKNRSKSVSLPSKTSTSESESALRNPNSQKQHLRQRIQSNTRCRTLLVHKNTAPGKRTKRYKYPKTDIVLSIGSDEEGKEPTHKSPRAIAAESHGRTRSISKIKSRKRAKWLRSQSVGIPLRTETIFSESPQETSATPRWSKNRGLDSVFATDPFPDPCSDERSNKTEYKPVKKAAVESSPQTSNNSSTHSKLQRSRIMSLIVHNATGPVGQQGGRSESLVSLGINTRSLSPSITSPISKGGSSKGGSISSVMDLQQHAHIMEDTGGVHPASKLSFPPTASPFYSNTVNRRTDIFV